MKWYAKQLKTILKKQNEQSGGAAPLAPTPHYTERPQHHQKISTNNKFGHSNPVKSRNINRPKTDA